MDPKTYFWKFKFLGKVILHMPVKFEQAGMKNEWGVRENVKLTYDDNDDNDNNERQTLGVTDAITTAVSIPQC